MRAAISHMWATLQVHAPCVTLETNVEKGGHMLQVKRIDAITASTNLEIKTSRRDKDNKSSWEERGTEYCGG